MQVAFPSALVNAFVVEADVPTLVDTGTPGSAAKLISALRGRSHVGRLRRIILTHRHADHAGNAAELARVSGAEVFASPDDAPYVSRGIDQPRPRAATRLGQFMVPYVKLALPWAVERVDVDADLIDGTQIGPFRVIATPGHTAGHVSLLWEERGILFTGDAAANVTRVGPHPAADDPATARESFRRLGTLDFDVACFGHGRPVVGDAARQFRAAT
jgi:glyoxylase-like metal-dependent hydrolase (beta-lactamase superfamily II)